MNSNHFKEREAMPVSDTDVANNPTSMANKQIDELNKHTHFVKSAKTVGFTDDQIYFLYYWISALNLKD